ncbi:10067_t:CDS:2 [Cetraspora pellucida]|uniref:10067_t:CDS:1 n=1 Tax=Cetraspora pellucida TaxID=1433469 RepID=A0ACA9PS19_9GLOM|nr:10067_t:CDS:2 [Cetraspora pellucida]
MMVSISTDVVILNKVANSNKCPLKISFIGVPQEFPKVLENDENAIFNVLINDYAGQNYDFIVKVVFLHSNSRFAHLKNVTHLQDSLLFVVDQMEIIDNDFYVYAKEINFVDDNSFKKRTFCDSHSIGTMLSISSNDYDKFQSSSKRARVECSDEATIVDYNESDKVDSSNEVIQNDDIDMLNKDIYQKKMREKEYSGCFLRSALRSFKPEVDDIDNK